jgi:two-component system, NarL family, nitrate/nitrite response regulator NarL
MSSPKLAAKPAPIQILIADDDPLVRAAITTLLSRREEYRIVGEATDGEEAVALARTLQPDLLLLDLNMPRKPGLDALRQVAEERPAMKTIVLTLAIERRQILEALQLGRAGHCAQGGSALFVGGGNLCRDDE